MGSRQEKRRRWFAGGVEAVSRVWPDHAGEYRCPLCGKFFSLDRLKELSFDHAPPEQLGGKRMALTCNDCNSRAGQTVDAAMIDIEDFKAARSFNMAQPRHGRIAVPGADQGVVADIKLAPGQFLISAVPKATRKGLIGQLTAELEQSAADPGREFVIRGSFRSRYPPRLGAIGWLKAAYLVTFAALGYTYAFDRALDVVRQQIADPDQTVITPVVGSFDSTPDGYMLGIVQDPPPYASVAVQTPPYIVFLPLRGDTSFFDRLPAQIAAPFEPRGHLLGWPARPAYTCDLA